MSYLLNEPLITALVARLQTELPPAVQAINDQGRDDVVLRVPLPERILDYVPSPELIVDTPTLGIQELPSTVTDDIGSSFTGVHQLAVVVFYTETELRRLAWSLRRYMQAITTVALEGRQIGDAWGVVFKGTVPGRTLERPENPDTFLSWAAVRLEARREEAG